MPWRVLERDPRNDPPEDVSLRCLGTPVGILHFRQQQERRTFNSMIPIDRVIAQQSKSPRNVEKDPGAYHSDGDEHD